MPDILALGLKSIAVSGFSVGAGDLNSGSHVCMAKLNPLSHDPYPSLILWSVTLVLETNGIYGAISSHVHMGMDDVHSRHTATFSLLSDATSHRPLHSLSYPTFCSMGFIVFVWLVGFHVWDKREHVTLGVALLLLRNVPLHSVACG